MRFMFLTRKRRLFGLHLRLSVETTVMQTMQPKIHTQCNRVDMQNLRRTLSAVPELRTLHFQYYFIPRALQSNVDLHSAIPSNEWGQHIFRNSLNVWINIPTVWPPHDGPLQYGLNQQGLPGNFGCTAILAANNPLLFRLQARILREYFELCAMQ